LKLLNKYQTEGKKEKKIRLKEKAVKTVEKKPEEETKKPLLAKYGLNHVTSLVESGKAQLVAIAHNVEPIELVLHLPALCRKKGIPFCFIKGMERLGKVVHKKRTTCIALTEVRKEVKKCF